MNLATLKLIVRHFGVGWVVYRGWKSLSEKLGYWNFKIPSRPWDHFGSEKFVPPSDWSTSSEFFERRKDQGVKFFFDPKQLIQSGQWLKSLDPDQQWAEETANRIAQGEFRYFSARWINIGQQPDWFLNPYESQSAPGGQHFSKINEFGFGDVKTIWEASRFGFVFHLARSFGRTGDRQCAETYWRLLEHWMDANPPYDGINWKCGQESGLRFLAAVFGFYVFSECPATNAERIKRFTRFAVATGNRIEKHIGYAISQKNNHGISEAVVLWTIGILFPELKQADRWRSRGLAVLKQLCLELIYDDGAFSQHSANYHRLVLHLLAWTFRLAEVNEVELDAEVLDKFKRATHFIESLLNPYSGSVPRYGSDDGAMILALNHCDYFDFRPVVQLCRTINQQPKRFANGEWNEDLFWFGYPVAEGVDNASGKQALPTQSADQSASLESFPDGGVHRLSNDQTVALLKAGIFRHRPAQSDLLHVDISWKGYDVAIDPGTYTYNGKQQWQNIPFNRSQRHNSVMVDSTEPETCVSKFMLLPWNEAELVSTHQSADVVGVEWKRTLSHQLADSVVHHRAVIVLPNDFVVVLDGLWSDTPHQFTLHWLLGGKPGPFDKSRNKMAMDLGDESYSVEIRGSREITSDWVIGEPKSTRGWFSPQYLELEPAISLQSHSAGSNTFFQTSFGLTGNPLFDQLVLNMPESSSPYSLLDENHVRKTVSSYTR